MSPFIFANLNLVTNLNKTKNPSQRKPLRRVIITRGTTQITKNIFSSLTGLYQVLCLYAAIRKESTSFRFRSSNSEVISHWKAPPLPCTIRQLSLSFAIRPSSSQSFFVIFKFKLYYTPKIALCQEFFEKKYTLFQLLTSPYLTLIRSSFSIIGPDINHKKTTVESA